MSDRAYRSTGRCRSRRWRVSRSRAVCRVKSPDLKELCTLVDSPAPPVAELIGVETSVVVALEWNLNSPTPHQLVECFLAGLGFAVPPDSVAFEAYERIWQLAYWACDASSYLRDMAFEPVRMVAAALDCVAVQPRRAARSRRRSWRGGSRGARADGRSHRRAGRAVPRVPPGAVRALAQRRPHRADDVLTSPIGAPTVGKSRKSDMRASPYNIFASGA